MRDEGDGLIGGVYIESRYFPVRGYSVQDCVDRDAVGLSVTMHDTVGSHSKSGSGSGERVESGGFY